MPRFVIQQHDASRLHYDFGLEFGGHGAGTPDARRNPLSTQRESVRGGRTIEDVAAGG